MIEFFKKKIASQKFVILAFIAIIAVNLYFGLSRVEKFTAVDETRWSYDRVPKFWKSLKKGNWKGTSLCDKPGVTLAVISGTGLPFVLDPQKYKNLRYKPKTAEQSDNIEKIYFSLRLPVYLFTLFSLPFFFYFVRRLWNEKIALLSVIFIGLSPILLGISLIINTDAILWILMPFSLLSFLIYQKESASPAVRNSKKFLYISGIILGFAILNKFVANLLFPFFLALIFLKYILSDYSKKEGLEYFKKAMANYLTLILIAFLTILIFYPSAWVKPKELLNVTIYSMAFKKIWPQFVGTLAIILFDIFALKSFIVRTVCAPFRAYKSALVRIVSLAILVMIIFIFFNTLSGMKYYDFEGIFFMPKPDLIFLQEFKNNIFSAFAPLIYGLTPVVSSFFIITIIFLITARKIKEKNNLLLSFSLLLFILIFYLANSAAQISSTVRYQIIVYPIASIIAAVGLYELINLKIIKKYFSETQFYVLIALIVFVSFLSLRSIRPFFLSYASDWYPKKYILNPRDMGDGSWEASQYLNSLPDAKNLVVWTDKKQVCEKFAGKCSISIDNNTTYDYFITSTAGKREAIPKARKKITGDYKIGNRLVDPNKLYSENDFYDFKVEIGGRTRNFVKIISAGLAAK